MTFGLKREWPFHLLHENICKYLCIKKISKANLLKKLQVVIIKIKSKHKFDW